MNSKVFMVGGAAILLLWIAYKKARPEIEELVQASDADNRPVGDGAQPVIDAEQQESTGANGIVGKDYIRDVHDPGQGEINLRESMIDPAYEAKSSPEKPVPQSLAPDDIAGQEIYTRIDGPQIKVDDFSSDPVIE